MILRIEDIQNVSKIILGAVDNSKISIYNENIELVVENNAFKLKVTNREYFVEVNIPLDENEDFHATVNANLFLKLISQITTDTVEFKVNKNSLIVIGNGKYNIPLIYNDDKMLILPEITIPEISSEFIIDTDTLLSVLTFNSKELQDKAFVSPVQEMYYLDSQGAITFTSGACVNLFSLPIPNKLLLTQKVVKLFKLFKGSDQVKFIFGHDMADDPHAIIKLYNDTVTLTAIVSSNESMINSVPANLIRGKVQEPYPYTAVFKTKALLDGINRMQLFTTPMSDCIKLNFNASGVIFSTTANDNSELIYRLDQAPNEFSYETYVKLSALKKTFEGCIEDQVVISFGNKQAFLVARGKVYNVVQESAIV